MSKRLPTRLWISGSVILLAGLIAAGVWAVSSGNLGNSKSNNSVVDQATLDKLSEAQKTLSSGFDFNAAIARANAYQTLGNTTKAIQAWQYLIKNRPNSIQGYWGLGQIYVAQGKYSLAETNWLKAIEVDKTAAYENSYIQLADLYKTSLPDKRYKLVQILTQAMALNPEAPNYPLLLANYYEDIEDFKSAITFYQKAYQIDPKGGAHLLTTIAELKQKL